MYRLDNILVRSRHETQQGEIRRDLEQKDLTRYSSKSSPKLAGRAVSRLGDGLIRLGQNLKDGSGSKTSSIDLTLDCD